jgi:reactive intermediate/imine deaminase
MEESMQHHLSQEVPPPGGPYSHAVSAAGLLYLSGQRPVDPSTGRVVAGITAQSHQVLTNLITVLRSCGCTTADVVKVQVHLANIADFATFNEVYTQFFQQPYPARTTVGSALRDILVEVDLVAALPAPATR